MFDASVDFASMRRRTARRGAHSICDSDVLVYMANRARLSSTMERWTVDRATVRPEWHSDDREPFGLSHSPMRENPHYSTSRHDMVGRGKWKRDISLDRARSGSTNTVNYSPEDVAGARRVPLNER